MNATPKFIAWLSDGSDCWNHQLLGIEELLSLRERAQEATGGNIEVHAYPLHAHDAMREALQLIVAWNRSGGASSLEEARELTYRKAQAALALAKGDQ